MFQVGIYGKRKGVIAIGCDIHCYLARRLKDKNGYHWEAAPIYEKIGAWRENPEHMELCEAYKGRNYQLFGVLAGVRNISYEPIVEPRGLGGACPAEIVKEYERGGGLSCYHHASWLGLDEIADALRDKKRYPKWETYLCEDGSRVKTGEEGPHKSLKRFYEAMMAFAEIAWYYVDPQDVRVYFWFDS